jgi:hypothetical protein
VLLISCLIHKFEDNNDDCGEKIDSKASFKRLGISYPSLLNHFKFTSISFRFRNIGSNFTSIGNIHLIFDYAILFLTCGVPYLYYRLDHPKGIKQTLDDDQNKTDINKKKRIESSSKMWKVQMGIIVAVLA